MTRIRQGLAVAVAACLVAGEAGASGIGASYYVPGKAAASPVKQASCQTGVCGPVASCEACCRLGFACVDHATVPPCTAEGGCYPARQSFGWHQTKWRRWPGTEEEPSLQAAPETADELVPTYEEPRPEEEDQQAPPPIEEEAEEAPTGEFDTFEGFDGAGDRPAPDRPGLEIDLPPLPEGPIPTPRPDAPGFEAPGFNQPPRPAAPGFQDGPPGLPFGLKRPAARPAESAEWGPPKPNFGATPSDRPAAVRDGETPPPLPVGITRTTPERVLRRLPTTRYDAAVRPVSAVSPAAR